jgi:hypothetical protein
MSYVKDVREVAIVRALFGLAILIVCSFVAHRHTITTALF